MSSRASEAISTLGTMEPPADVQELPAAICALACCALARNGPGCPSQGAEPSLLTSGSRTDCSVYTVTIDHLTDDAAPTHGEPELDFAVAKSSVMGGQLPASVRIWSNSGGNFAS
jgi:hypothetical protein